MRVREHIKRTFNYISESRNYLYLVVLTFLIGAVFGFVFSKDLNFFDEMIKQLFEQTDDLGTFDLIIFIFSNNLKAAFISLFSFFSVVGIFLAQNLSQVFVLLIFSFIGFFLGVFPVFFVLFNGLLLGYVFSKIDVLDFWKILPHGVFELPAIFLSAGLGLKLGIFLFSKKPKIEFKRRFFNSVRVFFFVILPLLVVAAIIEGLLIAFYK